MWFLSPSVISANGCPDDWPIFLMGFRRRRKLGKFSMKNLQGKKALVTGAASGIGQCIAISLAQMGADLYLWDIDQENLQQVADQGRRHGNDVRTAIVDLAQPENITRAVQTVLADWGKLEILVNNAGVAHYGQLARMSADLRQRILQINLLAPVQLTHEFLPTLLEQPEAHVLNVCALLGLIGTRKMTAYCTSKYGLVGFSEALRAEMAPKRVGVTALCPGFVETGIFEAVHFAKKPNRPPRWSCVTPEFVAGKAIRAIRRNQGTVVVSPMAQFLWRFKRYFPGLLDRMQGMAMKWRFPWKNNGKSAGDRRLSETLAANNDKAAA